jgi:hypothetical protein
MSSVWDDPLSNVDGDLSVNGSIASDGIIITDDIMVKRYHVRFRNKTGSEISSGTGLKIIGFDSQEEEALASPISSANDLVSCITMDNISNNFTYIGVCKGIYTESPLNTSGATIGDDVYVNTANGTLNLSSGIKIGIVVSLDIEGTIYIDTDYQFL